MHSTVKYIVKEIEKSPFKRSFNIVSFDSLSSEDLLQVFSDVLAELDPSHKIDLRVEVPEQTIVRILSFLRVLKYRPDANISPQAFRQGLLNGDKQIIHPILEWLLRNNKDLQKRAYLGKFLVKLEIPNEMLTDVDVYNMYEQYEGLVENFKAVHKESESIENSGVNINELRNDLTAMENERDIVVKRLDLMSRKIDNVPNKDQILRCVTQLRLERDKKREILTQLSDETAALHSATQRYNRLSQQLIEIKRATVGATAQSLLSRLEEEIQVTGYIVKDKLSQDLIHLKRQHEIYNNVANDSSLSKATLESLGSNINMVRSQVNALLEKQKLSQNNAHDKLAPFRQQAAIIGRKKSSVLDEYRQVMSQYQNLQARVEEKQLELAKAGGLDIPRGEEYKAYIARLKTRNLAYKQNRAVLSNLKSETGVLQRTLDVLQAKSTQLGVSEDADVSTPPSLTVRSKITPSDSDNRDELIGFVTKIINTIATHKIRLTPLLDDLRPLREEAANVTEEYEEVKKNYDRTNTRLEAGAEKLNQEVASLRDERLNTDLAVALLKAEAQIARVEIQRSSGDSGKSMRDAIAERIQKRETVARNLKEASKKLKETEEHNLKQKMVWSNLVRLFEAKEKSLEAVKKKEGTLHLDTGRRVQTLILN